MYIYTNIYLYLHIYIMYKFYICIIYSYILYTFFCSQFESCPKPMWHWVEMSLRSLSYNFSPAFVFPLLSLLRSWALFFWVLPRVSALPAPLTTLCLRGWFSTLWPLG